MTISFSFSNLPYFRVSVVNFCQQYLLGNNTQNLHYPDCPHIRLQNFCLTFRRAVKIPKLQHRRDLKVSASLHFCYVTEQDDVGYSDVAAAVAAAKSRQLCQTLRPHRQQPNRLFCPWDSPGKNTGVGCHFLLQCTKVKNESQVVQSCLTLSDSMDSSLPGSSVLGILLARVLEWVAIAFSEQNYVN